MLTGLLFAKEENLQDVIESKCAIEVDDLRGKGAEQMRWITSFVGG